MKHCTKCKVLKDFTCFNKNKRFKDGLTYWCKECLKIASSKRREIKREKDRQYYAANREAKVEYRRKYREANKVAINEAKRIDYFLHRDERKAKAKIYRESNKDLLKKRASEWYRRNASLYLHFNARRRAAQKQALPLWLNSEQLAEIKDFYVIAKMFRLYTGQEYHVDHIVPLRGETVCGLHVPWNLQVLPAKENLSKRNKLEEI